MSKMSEYLHQVPTKKKIATAVNLVIIVFMIAILVAFAGLATVNSKMNYFYKAPYANSTNQLDIQRDLQATSKFVLWAINTDDAALTEERVAQAEESSAEVVEHIAILSETFEDTQLMGEVEAAFAKVDECKIRLLEAAKANKNEEAIELYDTEYAPAAETLEALLERVGQAADEGARSAYINSVVTACIAFGLLVILTIVSIITGITLTRLVTRIIVKPVEELRDAADKISQGDLDIQVNYQGTDEFGELAEAFRVTCKTLHLIISDLEQLLGEMKDGNFKVKTQCEDAYVGAYANILQNFRAMVVNQNTVLRQIQGSSEQVNLGATQMAENAQALAEGATEQAGAVQELTATIENVTSATAMAADVVMQAYEEAEVYLEQAAKGNQEMESLTRAMEKIDETSRKIESIIGQIEDIASQTNLLSLNASIEAARAGEAGRGFAVVADQIGKLAADSGASAVSTRELILECLEDVQNGNDTTERTREVFGQLIEGIEKLAEVSKNTSKEANAQVDLMRQVQKGIEQISGVVQSNSASAEETSATSEELSAQAETLNELVDAFQLREE